MSFCALCVGLILWTIGEYIITNIDWCKTLGHRYRPIFREGKIKGEHIKIITCFCERCRFGKEEDRTFTKKMKPEIMGTCQEKYFIEPTE